MSIKVVVFDFDGTLVDSNHFKCNAWFAVFKDNPDISRSLVADVLTRNVGTRFDIVRDILVRSGAPASDIDLLVEKYVVRFDDLVQKAIADRGLIPGANEVLDALSPKHCLYINSGTPEQALHTCVENLGIKNYFKGVHGAPPTKEENLRAILVREGIAPEEAVVIGDGEGDCRSARACGAHFIAVASGFHDWSIYTEGFPVVSGVSKAAATIQKI